MPLTDAQVTAYLDRIRAPRPAAADPDALRALHLDHLRAVPFENLSIHLKEPVVLTPEALFEKVVVRRRGGFCYELNGLFAELLTALGYRCALLAARVHGETGYGPLFDHLALAVTCQDGTDWLVDVGFGRHTDHPLRLDVRTEQSDPTGVYRIAEHHQAHADDLVVLKGDVPQYLLETRPRTLGDFELGCWWNQTSPQSHFTRNTVCTLRTATGRVTLSSRTLIETDDGGERRQHEVKPQELADTYAELFGFELDPAAVAAL
ncbi:arylamine N-acetyltransferase family protein [Streptacidiphilus rugosus]|uniref:arylamine N-acetyltransferase family protein n=1 Tax=Streptacidiphilus rugosus TaxID=405783 RepID=UPI000562CD32|nr:arylamine N-acetyltransferase [Streptacidiphilus rugosus]